MSLGRAPGLVIVIVLFFSPGPGKPGEDADWLRICRKHVRLQDNEWGLLEKIFTVHEILLVTDSETLFFFNHKEPIYMFALLLL